MLIIPPHTNKYSPYIIIIIITFVLAIEYDCVQLNEISSLIL